MNNLPIVTIDGPAGVGKTTLAKSVASNLKLAYLDTGAMFRCLALKLGEDIEKLSEHEIEKRCNALIFTLKGSGADSTLFCNDIAIGDEIRTENVGMLASKLATIPIIREILKNVQREIGHNTSLVVEGRDMGTVVFPTAKFKFFLDASPEIRAMRRLLQLEEKGEKQDLALLTEQIRKRDAQDRERAIAPLCPASDAIIIDTSHIDIDEVLKNILRSIDIKGF